MGYLCLNIWKMCSSWPLSLLLWSHSRSSFSLSSENSRGSSNAWNFRDLQCPRQDGCRQGFHNLATLCQCQSSTRDWGALSLGDNNCGLQVLFRPWAWSALSLSLSTFYKHLHPCPPTLFRDSRDQTCPPSNIQFQAAALLLQDKKTQIHLNLFHPNTLGSNNPPNFRQSPCNTMDCRVHLDSCKLRRKKIRKFGCNESMNMISIKY